MSNNRSSGGYFSKDAKKLIYSSDKSGIFNIYEVDLETKLEKQITYSKEESFFVRSYSPITGEIISEGDFRVDGSLEGTLKTNGKVIIGVDGLVKGKVESANADIDLALSDPNLKLSHPNLGCLIV